jgi:hypothetical protein
MATELKDSASVGGLFCFVARLSELELAEQIEVLLKAKSMEDAVERTAGFRRWAGGQRLRIEAARNKIQFGVGQSEGLEVSHVRRPFCFAEATPRRLRLIVAGKTRRVRTRHCNGDAHHTANERLPMSPRPPCRRGWSYGDSALN